MRTQFRCQYTFCGWIEPIITINLHSSYKFGFISHLNVQKNKSHPCDEKSNHEQPTYVMVYSKQNLLKSNTIMNQVNITDLVCLRSSMEAKLCIVFSTHNEIIALFQSWLFLPHIGFYWCENFFFFNLLDGHR